MKLPKSRRLDTVASLVRAGARLADVGTDHGYLPIRLILEGITDSVTATELREKPLEKARRNAKAFGLEDKINFILCDGLELVSPRQVDTVTICGMGGGTIAGIIERAPWLKAKGYTLIAQPASSFDQLRRYLYEEGFDILTETLALDGGRLYPVILACYSGSSGYGAGDIYASPALVNSGSPHLQRYLSAMKRSLETGLRGTGKSSKPQDIQRNKDLEVAYRDICKVMEDLENDQS